MQNSRNRRTKRKLLVGMLKDMEWNSDREHISSWTDVTTSDWADRMRVWGKGANK
jgi:hypothetical protein